MSLDPSIPNPLSPPFLQSHHAFSANLAPPRDPTAAWIAFLMSHGGFLTLLGVPALIATAAFLARMRYLLRCRTPHAYGRTNITFWPEQILISVACLVLLATAASLCPTPESASGLLPGVLLTLCAWVTFVICSLRSQRYLL